MTPQTLRFGSITVKLHGTQVVSPRPGAPLWRLHVGRTSGADPLALSKATYRQGDLAMDKGDLLAARTLFETALAIIQPIANADPTDTGRQHVLSVSHARIGAAGRQQEAY
jgi:hypothetical protein